MKVKVLTQFHDKENYAHIFAVGEIADFDEARANSLVARKLAEAVESVEQKAKSEDEGTTSQGVVPNPQDNGNEVPTDSANVNETKEAEKDADEADNANDAEKAENVAENANEAEKAEDATEKAEKAETPKRGRKATTKTA